MIKNGRPYTVNNLFGREAIDDDLLDSLEPGIQKTVVEWIRENIYPRKTVLLGHTSYGLKHYLQNDIKIYLTNNQFKDAMMKAGYYPTDPDELNWHYCISAKSPIFKKEPMA